MGESPFSRNGGGRHDFGFLDEQGKVANFRILALPPVHAGGGMPLNADRPKVIGFVSITSRTLNYNDNAVAVAPLIPLFK